MSMAASALSKNHWVISLEAKPKQEFEVIAGRMKFVEFYTTSAGNNQNTNEEPKKTNNGKTDISSASNSDSVQGENRETINTSNVNSIQWNSKIVTIDAHQVFCFYTYAPIVHIANITNMMPRQFFEQFMPIEFIILVVIPLTNKHACECEVRWNDLTWMEFMRFIGILMIMIYVKCTDICDYWSVRQETNGSLFYLANKKCHYWPKNISHNIMDALKNIYESFVSRTCNMNNVGLIVCSIQDHKDIVLLTSCSTTIHGTEVKSAIDILNNLYNNTLSYHDIIESKRSTDCVFAFYLAVAETDRFSAYCQFVPGKQNTKKKQDSDHEHYPTNLTSDPATLQLKSKYVQHQCTSCSNHTTTCCSCSII
ncbi:21011_t:CDS:2 [Gigaspora margarita]|uniref:21011_t:CDS:1 n=1 Tax=Gigaspora margarita TaxID=4874 RepID=A0ABM8VY54_GIGMA|nr:21011_t:CDS:2 [Gigaspora margarita]